MCSYSAFTVPWRLLEVTLLVVYHFTLLKGVSSLNTWPLKCLCPNIWGAKGNVYRILLYVYKILPYISSIAWIIRINTIYHNKLLPSSSKMLSSSSKMLSSSSKMLSSSSGNAIIVIEDAIIVIGKCYHRHREMLSSSSGNAIIVIEDDSIVIGDAIIFNRDEVIFFEGCYHRQ